MKGEVYTPSNWVVYKTAELYYVRGKSRKEIERILHISSSTLSRILKRANQKHIVEFSIRQPFKDVLKLEEALRSRYSVKDIVVVLPSQGVEKDAEEIKKSVALEGARYVQRILKPDDVLGIAWGGTMYYLINYLNPCRRTENTFVTLHGSLSCCDYELDVNTLVHRMSMAFGGSHASILPGGLQVTKEVVQELQKQERGIFSLFKRVTIAVSGIGSFYPETTSPLSRIQYLKPEELQLLKEKGVYCDLMLRFLDENGRECDTGICDRTLAITLETYKQIPCKIIAASGKEKAYGLRAVLRGGLADIVIVDDALARDVMALNA